MEPPGPNRKKLKAMFQSMDIDGDGRVTVSELSRVLKSRTVPDSESQARHVISKQKIDQKSDSESGMTFTEFVKFVTDQDTLLKLAFKKLDKNEDEQIDAAEIKEGMADLGVTVTMHEAEALLKKMDKDDSLTIDFNEWREFLLFSDASDIKKILSYWHKASALDVSGEGGTVPDEFTEEEVKSGTAWKSLVAGGVAGAVSRSCTAPFDRMKVVWQVKGGKAAEKGMLFAVKEMLKEGGVKSMWRGNGINCVKIAPETALKFTYYEYLKNLIKSGEEITIFERLIAGGLAGAISQTCIYPIEVLKTRMTIRKTGQYSSIFDCAGQIYREGGVKIFFRGFTPNMLGILPYAGIDLALYETFRSYYSDWIVRTHNTELTAPPVYITLCAGASSSALAQLATYPLALVRTKLQANTKDSGVDGSMSQAFRQTVAREGPIGLYRGIGPNMAKVLPSVSIAYVIFEEMKKLLRV